MLSHRKVLAVPSFALGPALVATPRVAPERDLASRQAGTFASVTPSQSDNVACTERCAVFTADLRAQYASRAHRPCLVPIPREHPPMQRALDAVETDLDVGNSLCRDACKVSSELVLTRGHNRPLLLLLTNRGCTIIVSSDPSSLQLWVVV